MKSEVPQGRGTPFRPVWAPHEDGDRAVLFRAAYHRCSEGHGIGDTVMVLALRHKGWAVSCELGLGAGLMDEDFAAADPDCTHPRHNAGFPHVLGDGVRGRAVNFHTPVPMWEGNDRTASACVFIDAPEGCYGNVGYLIADDVSRALRAGGDDVWAHLRRVLDRVRESARSPHGGDR